jgi:multidrug efflux pump subunit AcrB
MWIVRLALRRPYTFVVAALLLVLMTPFVLVRTLTDIFPTINIPLVSVIWSYTGLREAMETAAKSGNFECVVIQHRE